MAKIAHLRVTCPQCGKWTDIYVVESAASSAEVKCQLCKSVFVFGAGMMYDPVGYVSKIPNWARIASGKARNAMPASSTPQAASATIQTSHETQQTVQTTGIGLDAGECSLLSRTVLDPTHVSSKEYKNQIQAISQAISADQTLDSSVLVALGTMVAQYCKADTDTFLDTQKKIGDLNLLSIEAKLAFADTVALRVLLNKINMALGIAPNENSAQEPIVDRKQSPLFYCFFAQDENPMEGMNFALGSVTDERVPSMLTPQFPAASGEKSKVIHPGAWKAPEFGRLSNAGQFEIAASQSDQQYAMNVYMGKKKEMYASIKAYLTEHEGVSADVADAALKLTEQHGIECVIPMTGKILVGVPVGFGAASSPSHTTARNAVPPVNYNTQATAVPTQMIYPNKKKGIAIGLWFLGAFGFLNIHNFYLGKVKIGLLKLALYFVLFSIGQALGQELPAVLVIVQLLLGCLFVWNLVDLIQIIKLSPGAFGGAAR